MREEKRRRTEKSEGREGGETEGKRRVREEREEWIRFVAPPKVG